jgi:hypothetical protein
MILESEAAAHHIMHLIYHDPKYKGKIILAHPQEDDAVLPSQFKDILSKYYSDNVKKLLKQGPTWIRGAALSYIDREKSFS